MSRYALFVAASLVITAVSGCDHDNRQRYTYGDCNGSGCFGCTDPSQTNCWPLPYTPCKSQGECKAEEVCTTLGCAARCTADTDCRDGEVCTGGGYCAPGSAKSSPISEPGNGTGTGTGTGNNGSDGGLVNQSEPGVVACALDSQCQPGQACVAGQCTHSASCGIPANLCNADQDCGTGRACYLGLCRTPCRDDAACPTGQMCTSGTCVDSTKNAQCVFDYQCGPASRCINAACHALCAADNQCGKGEACDSGVCRADVRPATRVRQ